MLSAALKKSNILQRSRFALVRLFNQSVSEQVEAAPVKTTSDGFGAEIVNLVPALETSKKAQYIKKLDSKKDVLPIILKLNEIGLTSE